MPEHKRVQKPVPVQNVYLAKVRDQQTAVVLYLTNGGQLQGKIKDFDDFTVVLFHDKKDVLIFKSQIVSVTPRHAKQLIEPPPPKRRGG